MASIQGYVSLDGSRLFYTVSGEGSPLVLLHGNFTDHRIWDEQADFFAAYYQVIRYDLRGYGQSGTPHSAFSNADDLKALIDALQLQKVTLVGSSSGGSAALDFTLAYPSLVQALILVAPSISGAPYPLGMITKVMKNLWNVRLKGRKAAIEAFIQDRYWRYFFPAPQKEKARAMVLQNIRRPDNFCRFPPHLSVAAKPYAVKRLHEVAAPTLIVIADNDHPYNIKNAKILHSLIPRSSICVIPECGHLPFVEEPEVFNQAVLDFCRMQASKGGSDC